MSTQESNLYKEHIQEVYTSLQEFSKKMTKQLGIKNAQLLNSNSHNYYNSDKVAIIINLSHKGINKLHLDLQEESKEIIQFNLTIYAWVNAMNAIATYFLMQEAREELIKVLPEDLLELLYKTYPDTKRYVWTTSFTLKEVIANNLEYINMYPSFLLIHLGEDR